MQQVRSIMQLLEKGLSLRAIATELSISRQSVTLYATKLRNAPYPFELLRQLSDADLAVIVYTAAVASDDDVSIRRKTFNTLVPYFIGELKRTGVTRQLLWQEYSKEHEDHFGYTQFCILLKEIGKLALASMHLVHQPAAMVMVDFAGDKMSYIDRSTGEVVFCPVFICVLPFSKYTYAMALPDATIPSVIKALNGCMYYFGGATLSLTTDNMKQIVTKSCRYEPLFTDALQQWATHYNLTLLATRVARPKDKASVENEVKIAYQRIYAPLRDEQFYDLNELNIAITKQLKLHNEKLFQLKDHSRLQKFEQEEKPFLQALPPQPYVMKHSVQAKVQKNYHITLGENYHHYSVPYLFIGKEVNAVYDTDIVEVYFQFKRIALHKRSYKKHGFTTTAEHMPAGHQQFFEQKGWTPLYFLEKAAAVGVGLHRYMDEVLKGRAFTEQTYNACRGILRLEQQYGKQRLEAACNRALSGSVYNYRTIDNILTTNQDLLTLPEQGDLFSVPEHPNLRGPDAYQ